MHIQDILTRSVLFLLLNNQNVRNFHCMLRNARHVLWAVSKLVEAVNNICVVGGEIDHIFKDVEVAWHSFIYVKKGMKNILNHYT